MYVGDILVLSELGILSLIDLKYKKLHIGYLIVFAISGGISIYFKSDSNLVLSILGLLVGLMCVFISKVTHEKFGMADSVVIGVLGLVYGLWNILAITFYGMLFVGIYGGFQLVIKHVNKNKRVAFLPYLMAGIICNYCFARY
ncbi:MAG: hypothetical protein LBM02_09490 [Lachnospiraceae bacterium]|jgi:prepilin signal peptidase PulO-like enzyme (type II secretory pathway)|nr:hypothetical protein [Lachnospiraceae bacterium]